MVALVNHFILDGFFRPLAVVLCFLAILCPVFCFVFFFNLTGTFIII